MTTKMKQSIMSLMGTMTPPIEKKVTLPNCADGCDVAMDDNDNADDHGDDNYNETINNQL